MPLSDKQREALIQERGEPVLRLEFDVFSDDQVSMWTHFEHGSDFEKVKERLIAVSNHLLEFIKDEGMCPFRKVNENTSLLTKPMV